MPAVERMPSSPATGEVKPFDPLNTAVVQAATKAARTRYVRFFAERGLYLLDRLTEREFVAFYRLSMEFVQLDGALPAADRQLAAVTKLSTKAWGELRDKLLVLGLGRIEHGHWIDDDQLANLQMQRRASERAKSAAAKSWAVRRAPPDEA